MKSLVVEDEFTTRLMLQKILQKFGEVHIAVNGREAIEAVRQAYAQNEHYDLISLDVLMPEMDGQQALRGIRALEMEQNPVASNQTKIIMTTALGDGKTIMAAFKQQCDGYLVKPIDSARLLAYLQEFGLIENN